MTVGGFAARGYEGVRDAFAAAQGEQPGGGQLCVYRHGEKVVDIWTGRDDANDRAFGDDTLTVIMSCTKAATATVVHQLVEQGLVELDGRVADVWPEFAANGKDDVRVWHLLTHSVGLPGLEPGSGIAAADLLVLDRHLPALEAMAPCWTPGGSCHYHPVTYGSLLDGLARKVSGKSISRLFAEQVAGPLGLEMWIGMPPSEDHRVAPYFQVGPGLEAGQIGALMSGMGIDITTRLAQVVLHSFEQTNELIASMNNTAGRAAELPAGNAVTSAASLARMYAGLIGDVDGVRLIRPETMERARRNHTAEMQPAGDLGKLQFGPPLQYGLGYELPRDITPMLGAGSFGHAGAGGRIGFAHPESGVAAGYVANAMLTVPMGPDPRWTWMGELAKAVA